MDSKFTTKALLWLVLVALSCAALSGIYVVVSGRDIPWQVVASLLSIGLFALTSLGASIVYFREVWQSTMFVSWVLSIVSLAFYLLVIWVGPDFSDSSIPRFMIACAIWSFAIPHARLLALTHFEGPWSAVRFGVLVILFSLALSLTAHAAFETDGHWQLSAVLGILTGLGTIGLPIAQKLYGLSREPPELESTPPQVMLQCPRCNTQQTVRAGKSQCVQCGLRIEVKVEEPRCPKCSYLLFQLTSDRCPECGTVVGLQVPMARP